MQIKERFDNFLYYDDFELIIKNNKIEISNYKNIENFSKNNIKISSKEKIYEINGNDLSINTLFDDYLLINGNIKSVNLINYFF